MYEIIFSKSFSLHYELLFSYRFVVFMAAQKNDNKKEEPKPKIILTLNVYVT